MKTFNKIQIAAIKRTAMNVAQFVTKKENIDKKIAALEEEKRALQPMIDAFQGPVKEMTGGYTTEDLVVKKAEKTGKIDPKTGKEVISYRYVLKYPETVIPVESAAENAPEELSMPMPEAGNDYDADMESLQQNAPHAEEDGAFPWD